MIETGKILQQRYRIDKQIGQGGMGAVYVATDERFGSVVAIKETLLMDDSYRKAIEREARLLNSLKHAALPRVSDHFLEENGQFLVMEYIPGEDLGCMMDRGHEPFKVEDVLNWADQLLEALDFLHNQTIPVVHRDIKPQNLKVTPRGQIILLDFGLAKGNPTDAGHHTAAKSIFGYSKNYASLEQIQGTGTDPRSDLYSLAATLYHLLTGVPPEDALMRAMSVLSQQADPLTPAHLIREEVPKGISGVLYRAMDLNAALRPSTAREMQRMLAEHEKYADFEGGVYRTSARGNGVHSEPTQLMDRTTRQEANKETDVKTEILPSYISQETSVRALKGGNSVPRGRKGIVAAVICSILAVGCAAGAFIYDPSLLGLQPSNLPSAEPPAPVEVKSENAGDETQNAVESGIDAGPELSTEKSASAGTTGKTAEKPGKTGVAGRQQTDRDNNVPDPDTVYVGNMRIKGDVIETPDTIIDSNGIHRKNLPGQPIPPRVPNLTPEQIDRLTPQQRRRLNIMIRRQRQQQQRTSPY